MMDIPEHWRPTEFPEYEVSNLGRVRRVPEILDALPDGTVALRTAGGRKYRSARKLYLAAWPELLPPGLKDMAPKPIPVAPPPAKPPEAKPLSSTFQRLMAQQAAKAAALEQPQDLTPQEIQALLARLG